MGVSSIGFPRIFNTNSTIVKSDYNATLQNLKLLLHSEKLELFGDPYYGVNIKRYMFEQNNKVLKDILIDDIYEQIALFMPQLILKRTDITITSVRTAVYCTIKATNNLDYQTNTYSLVLLQEGEDK